MTEPTFWMEKEELLRFFRRHKTELSCMENPHIFLSQLRDHDLIPDDRYQKVSRMKSKNNIKRGLYDILDWLEKKQSKRIIDFWDCVFNETIMNQYPTLRLLHNKLKDGSFHFYQQQPERDETEESDEGKRKKLSADEDGEKKQTNSVKKKRNLKSRSACEEEEEEEQAGPSSRLTPRKKSKKLCFLSNEEEDEDEDSDHDKEDQVSSSSKESSTDDTDDERQTEERPQQQPQTSTTRHDCSRKVFSVTCGALAATLHRNRFASGTRGKSLRTETIWLTPEEFVKEASCPDADATWRKDILYEGEPLSVLIEGGILRIHSLLCKCGLCKPDSRDLDDQKNDDECCVCKGAGEEELVECDHCPRSFHQRCHLPHVEDDILGDDRPWMCTFCSFRTSQLSLHPDQQKKEEVVSRQISQLMLQCQYLLLYLCSADEEQIFATNPCLNLQDYSTVIKTPMWLGEVADKLQEQLYQTVGEFVSDIQLIFTNCAAYNRDNAEFLAKGNGLKELFDGEFKSVFNISDN
ncbi:nuclear body protein SP140-like protein isoform X11 [Epinephelus fuscoguttatus]|uniref:nuclear body protein SP140-like protein isoform X9 n=1 Tax=Epinephelus fuscoguttatus TaxID=293821 RepID=UPI0020D07B22|nr:nuclear body protein SP140-like protein isoform X9 [Epinephelus fuscoguttatus]XP_049416673.1 nuclear body protein SP140-like protein isoform X10 [Epinephelus fuscoguttatus]XP_049416674.1 nuclear body protein SP140-like protein isoform X11 [Epinephelus fuscoguttatus]